MLVIISPAKKLNWDPVSLTNVTSPIFQKEALELTGVAKNLSPKKLSDLMKISSNLAQLNFDRFHSFESEPNAKNSKPAALAFAGDTYVGLEARTLDQESIQYAQTHLRILSGLYGLLRPLDQIQPYRLEMGSKLKTKKGKSLYEFWGDLLSKELNDHASKVNSKFLVNCASNEYFNAIDTTVLSLKVVTPVFLENKDGQSKVISFFAKKARGAMARFIIEQKVTSPDGLKDFDTGGYKFQNKESSDGKMMFARDHSV